jgi:hypothetical protein
MTDQAPDEGRPVNPIMTDQPEDEDELRERRRRAREVADQDLALRGAVVGGALGSNPGPVAGALIGEGGAIGYEQAEADLELEKTGKRKDDVPEAGD